MLIPYYVVDAFADGPFTGNPAGVCLLDAWPGADWMQKVAAENNLAETAFLVPKGADYDLRWFTPTFEIDLCGHATLASAFVLAMRAGHDKGHVRFHSMSGLLTVDWADGLFELDFPARPPKPIPVTDAMRAAVGADIVEDIVEAHQSRDLVLVLASERAVTEVSPNMAAIDALPKTMGVVVTARGDAADFVSRFFAPGAGIPEDPVTGSSHATLTPFWSERLHKQEMVARQLSARGGVLYCRNAGDRVKIAGRARLYLDGRIHAHDEKEP